MVKKAAIKVLVGIVISLGCLAMSPAWGWGPLGHRVICDVAWRASDKATKDKLSASSERMGYKTFATACLWADHIRSKKKYDHLKPLHYMNVSRQLSNIPSNPCRDTHLKKPRCVLSAIAYYEKRWKDESLSQRQRDEALLLMSHFVGDIHQPLHVSFKDDRGGTRRRVIFEGKVLSLHGLWDTQILSCAGHRSWRVLGKQLYREQVKNNVREPLEWARESYAITQKVYRQFSQKLPPSYCSQFNPVAIERLSIAGFRLSRILSKDG